MGRDDEPLGFWFTTAFLTYKFLGAAVTAALFCAFKWYGVWGWREVPYWVLAPLPFFWPLVLLVILVGDDEKKA